MNVVNREGGNGAVALTELAKTTAADGYTISLCSAGNFTTMPFVQDVGFAIDDFKFVIGTTSEPLAVIVKSDSELTNLKDIVDRYKKDARPFCRQSGANGPNHMHSIECSGTWAILKRSFLFGRSACFAALLGGEVEMILSTWNGHKPYQFRDGSMIAIVLRTRSYLRHVPTSRARVWQSHAETYKSLVVPAKTDPAIVSWLTARFDEMMADPAYIEFLKNNGLERSYYLGDEVSKVIKAEVLTLWPLMEELKILKKGAVKPA